MRYCADLRQRKMSRKVKKNELYEIAYGFDHAVGIFLQVFENAKRNDDNEGLILDVDEWSNTSLTIEEIVEIAKKYDFDIRYDAELAT